MIPARWIYKKFRAEIDGLYALAAYPLSKRQLLAKLARAMPAVNIETTNICNADCVFCAYQLQQRATGVMDMALYKKVVDEFSDAGGGRLSLTPTVGEPMVDKHLLERIAYARSKPNISGIGMFSNMISLKRIGAERLVNSGLSSLAVSTSGFDSGMYERVYRSPEYKRVLSNILDFATANIAAGWPVDLSIEMRVDRPVAEVSRYPDFLQVRDLIGASRMNIKLRYDNWAGKISQQALSGNMQLRSPHNWRVPRISPCSEMYSGPMIYWDGKVGACGCRDVDAKELIIGDVKTQTLSEIWLGNSIAQLRNEFGTSAIKPICQACTHYQNMSIYLRRSSKTFLDSVKAIERCPQPVTSNDGHLPG